MPPKTRGNTTNTRTRTTTRAALQARQLEKTSPEKEASERDEKQPEKAYVSEKINGNPDKKKKRVRIQVDSTEAEKVVVSKARKAASRTEARAKKTDKSTKAASKKKQAKMATKATTRKRRQKTAPANSSTVRGDGDGESVAVHNETPPPSKKIKDQPVEETDSIVVTSPPPPTVPMAKKKQKKATANIKKERETVPMETEEVPSVITHHSHSTVTGQIFVMGQGDMGQLGLGEDILERKKPHPVGGALEGCRVSQVVCGGMHTVALTEEGKVYTWGCNDEGALGRTIEDGEEFNPGLVNKLEGVKIVQVSAGDSHTAALTDNGTIYCWGIFRDSNGAFGLVENTPSFTPQPLYSNPINRALKVASGSDHVAFVTEHADIYTFGCAEQGQLGRVPECFSSRGGRKGVSLLLQPAVVRCWVKKGSGKPKFTNVFCGTYHTFGVTQSGNVYVWGLNNYGQLCTGHKENRYQPEQLDDNWIGGRGQGGVGVAKEFAIAGGSHHTVVCCRDDVLTCGRKEYGRLGLGEECNEPIVPTQIEEGVKRVKVVTVEAGGSCSFLITAGGEVYSWGMGTNLQLGMSDEEDRWSPVRVTGKKIEGLRALAVSAGGQHTAILMTDN